MLRADRPAWRGGGIGGRCRGRGASREGRRDQSRALEAREEGEGKRREGGRDAGGGDINICRSGGKLSLCRKGSLSNIERTTDGPSWQNAFEWDPRLRRGARLRGPIGAF